MMLQSCSAAGAQRAPLRHHHNVAYWRVVLNNLDVLPCLFHPCRQATEAARAAIIADERRKLLLQAADLAEFLPPGAVKDRQELELMRQHAAAATRQQQPGRF
jgi:hypothetical protein